MNLNLILCSTPLSLLAGSSLGICAKWLEFYYLFKDCIEFCEPEADGWLILQSVEFDSSSSLHLPYRDSLLFLLERIQEEITVGMNRDAIETALFYAARTGRFADMDLILKFDTQKVIHRCCLKGERPILGRWAHWLILQFLAEKGLDIQTSLLGETPTSRCLEFSGSFFCWRMDARILFSDIDRLIERETSESKKSAPRLRGWSFDLLRDLFSLDLDELLELEGFEDLKRPHSHWDYIYLANDDAMDLKCLQCGCKRVYGFFEGTNGGFIMEPWWEGVKTRVKNRKCLCSFNEITQDDRDGNNIIQKSCRFEKIDSQSEPDRSPVKPEYFSDTQSTQTQETESQPNFDTNDDTSQESARDTNLSGLIRAANPTNQHSVNRSMGRGYSFSILGRALL
jgi:hypothetical protein